jgi:hypothetical protein
MGDALIDDQPRLCRGHRRPQQRLLARQPGLQIGKAAHIARQRDLGEIGRRHIAKLAQKYKADHLRLRCGEKAAPP